MAAPSSGSSQPVPDGREAAGRLWLSPLRSPSSTLRRRGWVLLTVGLIVLGGVGFFGSRASTVPPSPGAGPSALSVTLEIRSSLSGIDQVVSPTLSFAAGSVVTFHIVNFDSVAVGAPASAAGLQGDFRGPVTLAWGAGAPTRMAAGLAPSSISHTFTVQAPYLHLNVPIPAALSSETPAVVSFTVELNATGQLSWYCAAYCEDGGLGDAGEMGGPLTVTPA
ncbi:MAG TPA: hypothetical protein VEY07_02280 [Thermoplasmata archaeon]|nr:hypothetical protein [Thermoplasmata archaeon]